MAQDIRAEAVVELKPLKVVILDHGEKVRVVDFTDPRAKFMELLNEMTVSTGIEAHVA
jgi:hypothetical protein